MKKVKKEQVIKIIKEKGIYGAAKEFGISYSTFSKACKEAKIDFNSFKERKRRSFVVEE